MPSSTRSTRSIAACQTAAPGLLNVFGVGTDVAAVMLVTAGDNPERITTEADVGDAVWHRPGPSDQRQDRTGRRLNSGGTVTPTTRSGGS